MSEAKIVASGSPLFLKRAFNCGYHLRISKRPGHLDDKFAYYLLSNLGEGCQLEQTGRLESIYAIPRKVGPKLGQFFEQLDKDIHELRIESYGITCTTMDDVFQAADQVFGSNGDKSKSRFKPMPKSIDLSQKSCSQQWNGLFTKVGSFVESIFVDTSMMNPFSQCS